MLGTRKAFIIAGGGGGGGDGKPLPLLFDEPILSPINLMYHFDNMGLSKITYILIWCSKR